MRLVATALLLLVGGCARAVGSGADGRDLGAGVGGNGGSGGGGGGGSSGVDLGAADGSDLAGGGSAVDLAGGGSAVDLAGSGVHDLASAIPDLASGAPDLATSGGMPDHSREKVSAYGYQIGFTPQFVDQFLGAGGLLLDGSDFVDVELSGAGISSIGSATLAILGRSYDTTTSGGFSWQSFSDSGATASDFVSNVAPYRWYAADIGNTVAAGDANVLVRVKADGLSGSLVVNRIEICLVAN